MTVKNIQALRAVAVCLVVVAHFQSVYLRVAADSPALPFATGLGHTGVDLFFVISGFIMISVHWTNFGDPHVTRTFLVKRFVRIVPLYWLVTLLLAAAFALVPSLVRTWPRSPLVPSLLMLPMPTMPLLFVGWTLVYEMYFYYVFAALLNLSRPRAFAGLAIWSAIVLLAQAWPAREKSPFTQQYLGTLVLEFVFGVVVGVLVRRDVRVAPVTAIAFGVVLLAAGVAYAVLAHVDYATNWELRFLCFGLPMTLVVYGCVVLERAHGVVFPALAQRIGDASYSIYLWHTILYALVDRCVDFAQHYVRVPPLAVVAVPVAIVAAGMVLYDRIEVPLLRISRRLAGRVFPSPAT